MCHHLQLLLILQVCLGRGSGPPEGDTQDHPPAKTVARWDLTDSEKIVEAVSVPSSDPVVSGGAVATERGPPICEGALCLLLQ